MEMMDRLSVRALPLPCTTRGLLSFDFDGTLFDVGSSKVERGAFFELMRDVRARCGMLWGINTGRSPEYLREGIAEFCADMPEAFGPDFTVTMERHLHLSSSGGALHACDEWNAPCICAHEKLYGQYGARLERMIDDVDRCFPGLELVKYEGYSICVNRPEGLDEVTKFVSKTLGEMPEIVIQRAGPYMRFSHRDYHKGSTLHYAARAFGVDDRHVAIFGDGHNDLDAMKFMPMAYRCCPDNAAQEVKELVSAGGGYVSRHSVLAGVLDAVRCGVLPHFEGA